MRSMRVVYCTSSRAGTAAMRLTAVIGPGLPRRRASRWSSALPAWGALLQPGGDALLAVLAGVRVGPDVESQRLPQRQVGGLDRGLLHPPDADRRVGGDPLGEVQRLGE